MSDLRDNLEQGKREHRAPRYPGDLAADLLGVRPMRLGYGTTPRRHWIFWANLGALGAVAATIAVVMWRVQPGVTTVADKRQPVTILQPRADDEFSIVPELAGASLVPQDLGVVPSNEMAAVVPAMPSFPSVSEILDSAESSNETFEENI